MSTTRDRDAHGDEVRDGWAWRIGTLAGIRIKVHATFVMLLAWIALSHLMRGHGPGAAAAGAVLTGLVFVIVLLHELGHALVARRFGIGTRDITLLPIGGVARLERMPERPSQEMLVAFAGPAVNVALALALFAATLVTRAPAAPELVHVVGGALLTKLMWINVSLAAFNLVPAFPMDGGRVLRAVLALRMGRERATALAARVGRYLAVGFAALGVLWNPWLILIALFVWGAGTEEALAERSRSLLAGVRVRDAMITDLKALSPEDDVRRLADHVPVGFQRDFPVVRDGAPVGLLTSDGLIEALASGDRDVSVGRVMRTDFRVCEPDAPLGAALEAIDGAAGHALLVVHDGHLEGMVTPENVSEFVTFRAARRGLEAHGLRTPRSES